MSQQRHQHQRQDQHHHQHHHQQHHDDDASGGGDLTYDVLTVPQAVSQADTSPNLVLFVNCLGLQEGRGLSLLRSRMHAHLASSGWLVGSRHVGGSQVFYRRVVGPAVIWAAEVGEQHLKATIAAMRAQPELARLGEWQISYVFMKPILVGQDPGEQLLLTEFLQHHQSSAQQQQQRDSMAVVPASSDRAAADAADDAADDAVAAAAAAAAAAESRDAEGMREGADAQAEQERTRSDGDDVK
jgi:hypothetical protein